VERIAVRTSMRADIAAGLRFVLGHRLLRPIAMCTSIWNLFGNMYFALLVLFCVRDLHMTATTIGVAFSIGAVGAPLGALIASRVSRVLGVGRTIVLSAALGCSGLLVALAPASHPVPFLIAASFIGGVGVIYNITQVSLRQAICPPAFQGRMNATIRFLVWGTIPVGNVVGGALGATLGLRPTMVIGSAGTLLAVLPVALSPVRSLRTIEEVIPPELLASGVEVDGQLAAGEMPLPGAIAPTEPISP
jgi:MFS family permease